MKVKINYINVTKGQPIPEKIRLELGVVGKKDGPVLLAVKEVTPAGCREEAERLEEQAEDLKATYEHYANLAATMRGAAHYLESRNKKTAAERRYGCRLRIWDKPDTWDRYTLVPPASAAKQYRTRHRLWEALSASENPFHPQGCGQHVEVSAGHWLGVRIHWDDLPEKVQKFARQEYPEFCPPLLPASAVGEEV